MAADTAGTPDERAAAMISQMTLDEKLVLLKGYFGAPFGGFPGSQAAARMEALGAQPVRGWR